MEQHRGDWSDENDLLARRIIKIEDRLDRIEFRRETGAEVHAAWPLALGCAAIGCGYLGMGMPTHPYQYLFAGLLLVLAYHRRALRLFSGVLQWPLVIINASNLCLLMLIMLGGGIRSPLFWLKTPGVIKNQPADGGSWFSRVMPDLSIQWQSIAGISDWSIDLTKVQVFLLIATMAGALFRFSGFTSIIALALLIISIPAYLSFTWDWVLFFLIFGSTSFYLQSRAIADNLRYTRGR